MDGGGASGRDRAERLLAEADELDERATRLRQVAGNVLKGVEGEQAVAATLDSLRSGGWVVLHDRRKAPRSPANIDHLVVGPMGLLVIDAKRWSGRVTFQNGVLRCNGYSRQSTIAATVEVTDLLRAELAVEGFGDVPVTAVLCFDGDAGLTRAVEVSPTLHLVPRSLLRAWLTERQRLVAAHRAQELGAYLDRAHRPRTESRTSKQTAPRWTTPSPSPRTPSASNLSSSASSPPNSRPPTARRRRSRKGGSSLVKAIVLSAAILLGIGFATHHDVPSTARTAVSDGGAQATMRSTSTSDRAATPDDCATLASGVGSVLGLRTTGTRSPTAAECEYRNTAGMVVAYTRVGPSVRQVSGMATLAVPTALRLSCGQGYFQPAGHPPTARPSAYPRRDAASCVSDVRLGWTAARAAVAARRLVAIIDRG